MYIATHWNPIYWNTACLIVNSGSLEDNSEEELVDIYEPEHQELSEGTTFTDLPDKSGKIKKTNSTDYGKMAKALGDIRAAKIQISLIDINKSGFGFKPDIENNQILFGMKALLNVSDDTVNTIIANRPYLSPKDFVERVHPKKQAMISLIKAGAFDKMMDRKECMVWYIWTTCDKKQKITLQNMNGLIQRNLLPEDTDDRIMARRIYEFNRYLKAMCKDTATTYKLDERALNFLQEIDCLDIINGYSIPVKAWDKVYQSWMDIFRTWISNEQATILKELNTAIFLQDWHKYALGSVAAWEMEVLCFYYHDHELKNINAQKYGIDDFYALPETPEVERTFFSKGREGQIFKLHRIMGTCIAKNKTKSIVTILTTSGVVNVKFHKEYFALFDKQISIRGEDGVKHVAEKSWFNRGNMIIVMGIRSGDEFVVKKYANSLGHQLYKISSVTAQNELILQTERCKGDSEEDDESIDSM